MGGWDLFERQRSLAELQRNPFVEDLTARGITQVNPPTHPPTYLPTYVKIHPPTYPPTHPPMQPVCGGFERTGNYPGEGEIHPSTHPPTHPPTLLLC